MRIIFALPVAVLLGAAAAPPADLQTGRSVAVSAPAQQHKYWLSDDLNRLFLQKPAGPHGDVSAEKATH